MPEILPLEISDLLEGISKNYIWLGKFFTELEARAIARNFNTTMQTFENSAGFMSEQWKRRQIEMFKDALAGKRPRITTLQLHLNTLMKAEVIDLGGGSGWLYSLLMTDFKNVIVNYVNLELPSTIQAFSSLHKNSAHYKWESDLKLIGKTEVYRILYSNSCIQYFPDNKMLYSSLETLQPDKVVFDDLMLMDGPGWFSLQNYYGYLQVNRFFGKEEFIICLEKSGYELESIEPYPVEFNRKMNPKVMMSRGLELDKPSAFSICFKKKQ